MALVVVTLARQQVFLVRFRCHPASVVDPLARLNQARMSILSPDGRFRDRPQGRGIRRRFLVLTSLALDRGQGLVARSRLAAALPFPARVPAALSPIRLQLSPSLARTPPGWVALAGFPVTAIFLATGRSPARVAAVSARLVGAAMDLR